MNVIIENRRRNIIPEYALGVSLSFSSMMKKGERVSLYSKQKIFDDKIVCFSVGTHLTFFLTLLLAMCLKF